jgi:large subunit ribosomal protein L25
MAEVFNVSKRSEIGKIGLKRLRRTGNIPAILYGHGEASISLAVPGHEVATALRHSGKVVTLQGDVTEEALIRAVQWDTFGLEVLHLDLMRVSATETVEVKLSIVLRGEAAGVKEGGVLNHVMHEVTVNCPVRAIPDNLVLNLASLQLGGALHASDLPLPAGAELLSDPNAIVVTCNLPRSEEELAAPAGAVAVPELIRKPKEEGGEEE